MHAQLSSANHERVKVTLTNECNLNIFTRLPEVYPPCLPVDVVCVLLINMLTFFVILLRHHHVNRLSPPTRLTGCWSNYANEGM